MTELTRHDNLNNSGVYISKNQLGLEAGRAVALTLQTAKTLLQPRATIYDAIALGGYPIGGALNSAAHSAMSLEFETSEQNTDPTGLGFIWEGHKYKRLHCLMGVKSAKKRINEFAEKAKKNAIAFSVFMKNGFETMIREGFTREDLSSPGFIPGWRLRGLTEYNKMFLLYENFKQAARPRFVPELPTSDLNWEPMHIQVPDYLDTIFNNKFGKGYSSTMQRISLNDFPEVARFHEAHNEHPAINPKDITTPNYMFKINNQIVATVGNSFEVPIYTEETGTIPLVLAANLLVREDLYSSGIGLGMSFALKEQTFLRNPKTIYIADNVESTKNFWMKHYGVDHVVAITGWPVFERI